ncbi:MAG: HPr family phosphocarrier protein [Pseudomonadota bacterium]
MNMAEEILELTQNFTIINTLGLHARAAATFVKIANRFRSEITVMKDETSVNGKSIMGVLMLAASKDTEIIITAKGSDAKEALEALGKLIKDKFGEN